MPGPGLDDVELDPGLKQMQGGGVPDGVRADKFGGERRLAAGGHRKMTLQDRPQAVAGDPLAVGVEEQGYARLVAVIALVEVGAHGVGGLLP